MQQATCVHSGADTGTSSSNIEISSAPSRRALLGFFGIGAIGTTTFAAIPAAAIGSVDSRTFAARYAAYRGSCAAYEASEAPDAIAGSADAAFTRLMIAYQAMMQTPAPEVSAVAAKLDALLHEMEGAEIDQTYLAPILADLRRLAA